MSITFEVVRLKIYGIFFCLYIWDIIYRCFTNFMLNMKMSSKIWYYETLINYLYLLLGIVISPHITKNYFSNLIWLVIYHFSWNFTRKVIMIMIIMHCQIFLGENFQVIRIILTFCDFDNFSLFYHHYLAKKGQKCFLEKFNMILIFLNLELV